MLTTIYQIHFLASLVSSETAKLIRWDRVVGPVASVRCPNSVRPQRFDPLLGGVASPNFQDMFIGCPGLCPSFFLVKKFSRSKVKVEKVKNSKNLSPPTVFELGCSNFQDVFS